MINKDVYIQLMEQVDAYNELGVSFLLYKYKDIDVFYVMDEWPNIGAATFNNFPIFLLVMLKLYDECGFTIDMSVGNKSDIKLRPEYIKHMKNIERLVKILKMLLKHHGDKPFNKGALLWFFERAGKDYYRAINFSKYLLDIFGDKRYTNLWLMI